MNELVGQLVSQLGVQEGQAKGGAGLLLKLAQSKLGSDFVKVERAIPGVKELIGAAPEAGGVGKMLGGLAGALGGAQAADLGQLAGGFGQLKLDPAMIGKFAGVIVSLAQSKGGQEVAKLLAGILAKKQA
jgi:hypothetical protein